MAGAYPDDLRYTESDEWVRREGDEVVTGVTGYAAEQLGDVVYLQLPVAGTSYDQGQSFGEIESVKAVSDLYAPLSGEVLATNDEAEREPGLVNDDPYGRGWLVRLRPTDPSQLERLLDAAGYARKVAESE